MIVQFLSSRPDLYPLAAVKFGLLS